MKIRTLLFGLVMGDWGVGWEWREGRYKLLVKRRPKR